MTSLPARIARLHDRGQVALGMRADRLLFFPNVIQDRATFERPVQYAAGIDYIVVNGAAEIGNGHLTAERPGTVIRHRR